MNKYLKTIQASLLEMHTSPYILRASSANHSKNPFEYPISPLASAKGFPCSEVKSFAKSSLCSSHRVNHFLSNIDLSLTVVSFHEAKAYQRMKQNYQRRLL